MTRVYIVDDHSLFAEGLKSMLSKTKSIHVVGMASDAASAIESIDGADVDVVLLDVNLPDRDGVHVCSELLSRFPSLKIIALSMHSEASIIASMVEAGALGYVLKNAKSEELLEAISCAMKNMKYFSKEASNNLIFKLMGTGGATSKSTQKPMLTRREKDVLYLIMKEHTTTEIAEKLFVSPSTVETHRKNLLQKLEVRNVVGLAQAALEFDILGDYLPPSQ